MQRLTIRDKTYCSAICGQENTCQRVISGAICKDALRYQALQKYEDTGYYPDEIIKYLGIKEGQEVDLS